MLRGAVQPVASQLAAPPQVVPAAGVSRAPSALEGASPQSGSGPGAAPALAVGAAAAAALAGASRRRAGGVQLSRCAASRASAVVLRAAEGDSAASEPQPKAATAFPPGRPKVAVVGAGWGGLGAAKALCENGCEVVMIDAIPDPTGNTPFLTPSGKLFDLGTRGFWKDYPNMNKTLAELGVKEDDVFTDFTESAFYSPDGLEATAPVFGGSPELPSPLGQVFASFSRFKRLPVQDRLSISGLLLAMLDFDRDEETLAAYDRMTAHELFLRCGVSQRLVDDFLKPTLLVGLFKPPEELSAAVTMELLYFYALAHQTSFDVRWLRKGTVATTLIQPLVENLVKEHGLDVRGNTFAEGLTLSPDGKVSGVRCKEKGGDSYEISDVDGVVLALGSGGMRAVMQGSPEVAKRCPTLSRAGATKGIDCIACRLWLDGYVPTETPANVLSRFEGLRGAGGTFFMIDQLQPDQESLWGGEEPQGSVVACDFYNGGALFSLSDEEIVRLLKEELLPEAVPAFKNVKVVDSYVKRFGGAVTWFSPGSYDNRPTMETPISNLVCAGDWVRMGEREHGAKGLCQERALVSGFEAANSLARRGLLGAANKKEREVIPVRDDEAQVKAGRQAAKLAAALAKPFGLQSPWVR